MLRRRLGRVRAAAPDAPVDPGALRHFEQFMAEGDLVFDIGANVGDKTRIFREIGASVVAVEPEPRALAELGRRFGDDPGVRICAHAVAQDAGRLALRLNDRLDLASGSAEWISAMRRSGRFGECEWHESISVESRTLDQLISEHGMPRFCKLDIEGFELEALNGLSRPLPAASFEFAAEARHLAIACTQRLLSLEQTYEFALGFGESMTLDRWDSGPEVGRTLEGLTGERTWGDVYARAG